jgi:hypothetical protein
MTVVYNLLENTFLPTVEEISMVSVAGGISVGKHEGLFRVQGILTMNFPILSVPIELKEYAR